MPLTKCVLHKDIGTPKKRGVTLIFLQARCAGNQLFVFVDRSSDALGVDLKLGPTNYPSDRTPALGMMLWTDKFDLCPLKQ